MLSAGVEIQLWIRTCVRVCIVLRAFESGVSRNKFVLKGKNILKAREKYSVRNFLTYTLHQVLLNR
jgi:hypothetical protein